MYALHLINSIKPGGAENVAFNYVKVSKELGINSTIVGRQDSAEYEKYLQSVASVKYSLSKSDLRRADYVFIHSNINLLKILIRRPFLKKNVRLFYIQHLRYSHFKFRVLAILINLLCSDFIEITPITKSLVKRYIKIDVHFIVNFYITRYQYAQYKVIRSQVRRELNINEDKKIIVFSAVFKPGKGLKDVIELARIMSYDKEYFFLIIGDGEESSLLMSYESANMKWIGRVNDVERYLIASDIYFFPSRFKYEMMPMALIEAINTDKAIAAYKTEINDYLLNGQTYETLFQICNDIKNDKVPKIFSHFDESYAKMKLSQIINKTINICDK